jgi:hypothetical protein
LRWRNKAVGYWIRYATLIVLCIALPSVLTLYWDTQATVDRAKQSGKISAQAMPGALKPQLRLEAHRQVSTALTLAQEIVDKHWLADLSDAARKPAAIRSMTDVLTKRVPKGGYAWVIDASGSILARNNQSGPDENPENISGHPLFVETQKGFALDGFWFEGNVTFLTGAVPLSAGGEAAGAVFVARPIDQKFTQILASRVRGLSLTTVIHDKVVATTLPNRRVAQMIIEKSSPGSPVTAGELSVPIKSGEFLPFTPLFVDRSAKDLAYASIPILGPGGGKVKWIASVESVEPLRTLARRQESLIGLFVAAILLALLFGLDFRRSYVKPIRLLVDHLSSVQMRRGLTRDLEEFRVSRPFRRLVKLVNMTVKKLPTPTSGSGVNSGVFQNDRAASAASISDDGSVPLGGLDAGSPMANDTGLPAASSAQRDDTPGAFDSTGLPSATPLGGLLGSLDNSPGLPEASNLSDPGLPVATGLGNMDLPLAPNIGLPPAVPLAGLSSEPMLDGTGLPPAPPLDSPGFPPASPLADIGLPLAAAPASSSFDDLGLPPAQPMVLGGSVGSDAGSPVRSASEIRGLSSDALAERSVENMASDLPPPPVDEVMTDDESPFGMPGGMTSEHEEEDEPPMESTMIARVDHQLLEKSRHHTSTGHVIAEEEEVESATSSVEQTMVATVPQELLQATADDPAVMPPPEDITVEAPEETESPEMIHFKETYERFIELRQQCGEATEDLSFPRFEKKLVKNRDGLMSKYGCKTVRFQVYEKNGKAALKATPIRA